MSLGGSISGHVSGKARTSTLLLGLLAVALVLWFTGVLGGPANQKEAGMQAWREGRLEPAAKAFGRYLAGDPEDAEAQYFRAICLAATRNDDRALDHLNSLSRFEGWEQRAHYHTVRVLLSRKRTEEARRVVNSAPEETAKSPLGREAEGLFHLAQAKIDEEQVFELLSRDIGEAKARGFSNLGHRIIFASTKAYDRSLDAMIARIERDHGFKRSAQLRQILDRGHRHAVSAFAALQKIGAANASSTGEPTGLRYNFELATLLDQRGRSTESQDALATLIATPKSAMLGDEWFEEKHLNIVDASQRLLAKFLMTRKKFADAVVVLKHIDVNEEDGDYDVDRMLAECYGEMEQHDKMLAIADKWLMEDQTLATLNFLVGRHLLEKGRAEEALPYLEKASARRRRDSDYSIKLVRCYLSLHRFDNASTVLDRLISRDQTNVDLYTLRMRAMEGQGWIPDVVGFVVQALNRIFPDPDSMAHNLLRLELKQFIKRHDLMPADLFQASEFYGQDEDNHAVAVRFLELLVEKGDLARATKISDETLLRCPPKDDSYFGLRLVTARLHEARRFWKVAALHYEAAASANPAAIEPYLGQARTLYRNGDVGAAWRALRKAEIVATDRAMTQKVRFDLHLADEDFGLAAAIGRDLIDANPTDRELLVRVAEVHTRARDIAGLEQLLRKLDERRSTNPTDWVRIADLQLDAALLATGGQRERLRRDATRLLTRAANALSDDSDAVISMVRILSEHELHLPAIEILKDVTVAHPDNLNAHRMLATIALQQDDPTLFQDAIAVVMGLGARAWALEQVLRECLAVGALQEANSILESVSQEGDLTAPVLRFGIQLRLAQEDAIRARRLLTALGREESSTALELALARAKVDEIDGKQIAALQSLKKALKLSRSPNEAQSICLEIIRLLGHTGQPQELIAFTVGRLPESKDAADLLTAAGNALVRANDPTAFDAVRGAIKGGKVTHRLLFLRSILQLEGGDTASATTTLKSLFMARRERDTGRALAIAASLHGDEKAVQEAVRRKGDYRPSADLRPICRFIRLLGSSQNLKTVQAAIDPIDLGSRSCKRGVKAAIASTFSNPAERATLRSTLGVYLALLDIDITYRKAASAAARLFAAFPDHGRTFELLQARANLKNRDTYRQGIETATRMLAINDSDEAALLIYAEAYIASRNQKALDDLLSWAILRADSPISNGFRTELGQLLLDGDYPHQASLVLSTGPVENAAQRRLLATALFRDGKRTRAAHTLNPKGIEVEKDGLWHLIVGASMAEENPRSQQAFRLVSNAVYRFSVTEPEANLILAELAAKIGNTAEAEKNLRRHLALTPWSARAAREALMLIEGDRQFDFPFRRWLETRSAMLDPSSLINLKSN